jgi:hypothetical protein
VKVWIAKPEAKSAATGRSEVLARPQLILAARGAVGKFVLSLRVPLDETLRLLVEFMNRDHRTRSCITKLHRADE